MPSSYSSSSLMSSSSYMPSPVSSTNRTKYSFSLMMQLLKEWMWYIDILISLGVLLFVWYKALDSALTSLFFFFLHVSFYAFFFSHVFCVSFWTTNQWEIWIIWLKIYNYCKAFWLMLWCCFFSFNMSILSTAFCISHLLFSIRF